ncbi:g3844 [Coccomyxa viridis]|uniref:Mitochondrial import inner membrane translocase subunit n=1 Tax=Coccomyxa viridis TaxID=1274662 RepID=A0ABP1FVY3_9CHLO
MEGLENIPDAQKNVLMQRIEEMQVRDSLRMYNNLVEKCFTDCIDSFRRRDLDGTEEKCVQKCCEKFMKHSTRIGMRFAEFNSQAEAQMAQLMQQQAGK